jgi:N utilization substance protein A
VLSRSHPDFVRRLFELEVPEVAERIIEIKALAREAGYRTKVAVSSIDSKVDAVGACVGVRGSRIKNIVVELGGEKIDIVRWNESSQILITNALKPAEVTETALCFELGRATVVVAEDQLSLAIGKRGQNVRLGARLTGWDIDILTPAEYNKNLDDMERVLSAVEGMDNEKIEKLMALGIISLQDLEEVGTEPLINDLELTEELAGQVVATASEAAKEIAAAAAVAKKAAEEAKAAEQAAAKAAAEAAGEAGGEASETAEAPEAQSTEGSDVAVSTAPIEDAEPGAAEAVAEESLADAPADEEEPPASAGEADGSEAQGEGSPSDEAAAAVAESGSVPESSTDGPR